MDNELKIFIVIALIIISAYAVYALFKVNNYKTTALRSAQLAMRDEDKIEMTQFTLFLRAILRAVGINTEAVKRRKYVELGRAGLLEDNIISKFLFFTYLTRLFCFIAAAIVLLSLFSGAEKLQSLDYFKSFLAVAIFVYIGLKLDQLVINNRIKARNHRLYKSFPDAADLMTVCVEAGLSLDSALARICRELKLTHPEITEELERTRLELSLTSDRIRALHNLAERTDIMGFRSLVAALVQSEKYGTNLSSTLRVLSEEFRHARLLNAENKAARVPALMTLPLILFIFFPFIGVVLMPAIIKVIEVGAFD